MKGDFSGWDTIKEPNLNGVLHQQGRVLLDRDWNDQTQITLDWQKLAAKQIIGADVAAISAETPHSLKITHATVDGDEVKLEIHPGQAWVNGLAVTLLDDLTVTRTATYLEPPLQDAPGKVSEIKEGVRDAVVLEVWQEALNGFQQHDTLIEPALGGPDTTERVLTAMRFRLFRLAPDEDCHNITDQLKDDISQKGKLKVSLQPKNETDENCPVVKDGGYIGFEHNFYRIEIAQVNVNGNVPKFKWSQFNGGLVGRGEWNLDGEDKRIILKANDQAIKMSGLTDFYLEVVKFDPEQGYWRVSYGAKVTLDGDELNVTAEHYVESELPSGRVFFRLWNGIEAIANFPKATEPKQLRDGIRLEFDAPNPTNYRPGDYWTFKVRAGEIPNNDPIFDQDVLPQGIEYYRVPLAELNWDAKNISFEAGQIEDCRDVFRSLTKQKGCCTFSVGDGIRTHGDFDTIEDAIRHLPSSGGKICSLPGLHKANVELKEKQNITIEGCGKQTRVIPRKNKRESPIFHIIDSECIALLDLDLATLGGTAIVLEKTEFGTLEEIEIGRNRIIADKEAIHVKQGIKIHIHHNQIRMWDKKDASVGIYLMAEDSLIERNEIGVIPAENTPPINLPDGETLDPTNPCFNLEIVYTYIPAFVRYIHLIWTISLLFIPKNPFKALGGIQIAGGSERIKVWENKINGGAGNGIALGTSITAFLAELEEESPEEEEQLIEHNGGDLWGRVVSGETGLQNITVLLESNNSTTLSTSTDNNGYLLIRNVASGEYSVEIATPGYKIERIIFQEDSLGEFSLYQIEVVQEEIDLSDLLAFIYDIEIDHNEISQMGLSGIGLPRVEIPDPLPQGAIARLVRIFAQFLTLFGNPIIDLRINDNHIFNCFQNPINEVLRNEVKIKGLGGISLGLCANLAINRNRIETNGISHINPVCGIFVTYGEQMDIAHNWIADNGELTNATATLIPGKRGGIVLGASSFPLLSSLSTAFSATQSTVSVANTSALMGRPAIRVHDNMVSQPAGQALTVLALGSVSVVNNHFNSELSGTGFYDRLAGSVLIVNLAGLNRLGTPGIGGTIASTGAIAGTPTNYASFARNPNTNLLFPNGNTLFNNNQTRLGIQNNSLTSQWIYSVDDIGFDGNQSDDLGGLRLSDRVIIAVNTVLWAMTLRASDNRFKEILDIGQTNSARFSLLTLSILMNNTTNNQGDHCIFALNALNNLASPSLVTDRNQVLDARLCREQFPRPDG